MAFPDRRTANTLPGILLFAVAFANSIYGYHGSNPFVRRLHQACRRSPYCAGVREYVCPVLGEEAESPDWREIGSRWFARMAGDMGLPGPATKQIASAGLIRWPGCGAEFSCHSAPAPSL